MGKYPIWEANTWAGKMLARFGLGISDAYKIATRDGNKGRLAAWNGFARERRGE